MAGRFYGLGVGPGDPELITLKARRILAGIDILLAPVNHPGRESLALKVVQPFVPARASIQRRHFPMVKDPTALEASSSAVCDEIMEWVGEGKQVGFVTLGDPLLYSTYIYLLKGLKRRGIAVETVPGITSFSLASSRTGISLAEQEEKIAILPCAYGIDGLTEILERFDTVILMKVRGDCSQVVDQLAASGLKENSVFVSRLGLDREVIEYDLDRIRGLDADYFSMIIVRKPRN